MYIFLSYLQSNPTTAAEIILSMTFKLVFDFLAEPFNIKSEDTEVKSELDEEMYT